MASKLRKHKFCKKSIIEKFQCTITLGAESVVSNNKNIKRRWWQLLYIAAKQKLIKNMNFRFFENHSLKSEIL